MHNNAMFWREKWKMMQKWKNVKHYGWGMAEFCTEHGHITPKHKSWNFKCFNGRWASQGCPSIETYVKPLVETWHISMRGRFRVSPYPSIETCDGGPLKLPCFGWWLCLEAHCFWVSKLLPNCHQNMTCFVVSLLKRLTLHMHRIVQNKRHIYDLSVK
jgi:hypothetical protein